MADTFLEMCRPPLCLAIFVARCRPSGQLYDPKKSDGRTPAATIFNTSSQNGHRAVNNLTGLLHTYCTVHVTKRALVPTANGSSHGEWKSVRKELKKQFLIVMPPSTLSASNARSYRITVQVTDSTQPA